MNAALGSGCDTIDNAVTSNTRGPEFESSPWGFTSNTQIFTVNCLKKRRKPSRKRVREWPIYSDRLP